MNDPDPYWEYVHYSDGTGRLIRRAETPEDYFATLEF